MENHPIPQDVTGFQFKLIGNMTVKQFAYLATGIILGWVFLQLPISIFIKFPISVFFALFGIGLTFLPISGRPMDAMIGNYIKALLRPTQFFYEKSGQQLYYSNTKTPLAAPSLPFQQKDKLKAYLASQQTQQNKSRTLRGEIDEKENNYLMSVASMSTNHSPMLNPVQFTPLKPFQQPTINTPIPTPVKQASSASSETSAPQATPPEFAVPPSIVEPPVQKIQQLTKPFPTAFNRNVGVPNAPDSPNLITGITKDSRGNALSNILVEVKDKEGNPVRAFKTNEFGRFSSATPLINGNYSIEFEDPKGQNTFEKGAINAQGSIIQPIVAISIDQREELRRSLFSTNN